MKWRPMLVSTLYLGVPNLTIAAQSPPQQNIKFSTGSFPDQAQRDLAIKKVSDRVGIERLQKLRLELVQKLVDENADGHVYDRDGKCLNDHAGVEVDSNGLDYLSAPEIIDDRRLEKDIVLAIHQNRPRQAAALMSHLANVFTVKLLDSPESRRECLTQWRSILLATVTTPTSAVMASQILNHFREISTMIGRPDSFALAYLLENWPAGSGLRRYHDRARVRWLERLDHGTSPNLMLAALGDRMEVTPEYRQKIHAIWRKYLRKREPTLPSDLMLAVFAVCEILNGEGDSSELFGETGVIPPPLPDVMTTRWWRSTWTWAFDHLPQLRWTRDRLARIASRQPIDLFKAMDVLNERVASNGLAPCH